MGLFSEDIPETRFDEEEEASETTAKAGIGQSTPNIMRVPAMPHIIFSMRGPWLANQKPRKLLNGDAGCGTMPLLLG